ncbi:serine/threonine-protein kinase [Streptomyces sp. NPDC000410]|uniref:serine/threonine-protein kinase n=1 Tax=Streptomyces sp. NPDC000410 TaxID=3154254 RepID=UPI00333028AB
MDNKQSGTGAGSLLAGRYRLTESIGRGGMGKVWRAQDELLHRTVAVKELTAGMYASEADRAVLHARTQKEARAAARITHPNVVTVHDVLEHDDRPWIVMQYVDGPSLADAAKQAGASGEQGPSGQQSGQPSGQSGQRSGQSGQSGQSGRSGCIRPTEAARIGVYVLAALRAAHAAGVLHRDVKPGNVLLATDGRVLLTDFGIAAIEGDSTITRTGELVGSIDYLAPERVRGGDPGPASDLWSLGATLYTAVEGRSPFRRTSPLSTMQAVVTEEPAPTERAGPLAPVITALLRKEPDQRPSAAEVERMLLEAMEGRTPKSAQAYVPTQTVTPQERWTGTTQLTAPAPAPAPAPATAPAKRRSGRWRTAVLVVVLATVFGGGAGFLAMKYADGGAGTPSSNSSTGSKGGSGGAADPAKPGSVPAGWVRVKDPEGFSLAVPKGWTRQSDGNQIDYTPDNGRHRIRIGIDKSPDFENPYAHMLDLEKIVDKRTQYKRQTLHPNTYRDQTNAALWEFTWTETKDHPGKRRAIDQMYYEDDGTEYALSMSAPEEGWATTRQQFDTMLRYWQPPTTP